jgi:hypothetical protein
MGENTPSGQPRSSFHFSFPSRPKRRDLLWEGPSGGLVPVRCGHWSVVWSAEVGESRNTAVNRMRFRALSAANLEVGLEAKEGLEAFPIPFPKHRRCFDLGSFRAQENTRRTLFLESKMTSLARARSCLPILTFPADFMQSLAATEECIVCSFLQGLDLQRRVARPPTGSSGLGLWTRHDATHLENHQLRSLLHGHV